MRFCLKYFCSVLKTYLDYTKFEKNNCIDVKDNFGSFELIGTGILKGRTITFKNAKAKIISTSLYFGS